MNPIIVIAIIIIWLYILSVTKRAKLHAWSFMWGSLGLFVIMMMTVQPLLTMPLARCVAAMAGIVGDITGAFTAYKQFIDDHRFISGRQFIDDRRLISHEVQLTDESYPQQQYRISPR